MLFTLILVIFMLLCVYLNSINSLLNESFHLYIKPSLYLPKLINNLPK